VWRFCQPNKDATEEQGGMMKEECGMMNDECGMKDKRLLAFHSAFRIPPSAFLKRPRLCNPF
jgi:hypothetical protein